MPLTQIEVNLKKVAYALGALQGCTYAVLAIVCIIIYNQPTRTFTENSYLNKVEESMYYAILQTERDRPGSNGIDIIYGFDNQTLVPRVFDGFAWIHLILHLILCCVSLESLRRDRAVYTRYPQLWSYIVWMVCLWDFITVVILGADYQKCLRDASNWTIGPEFIVTQQRCANGLLPVLVIVAKGFVLWVTNLVFGFVLHSMGRKLKLKRKPAQIPSAVVYVYPQQQTTPQPATFQASHPNTSTNLQGQMPSSQTPVHPVQYYTPTNAYQTQSQPYQPYVMPSSTQNLRKEQFEFSVHTPNPKYDRRMLNTERRF